MVVHIVWHVRHAANTDGSPTQRRDAEGELPIDDEFDDVKLIGSYSTKALLEAAKSRARLRQGFRDEPECFYAAPFTVDEDHWTEGFVSIPTASTTDGRRHRKTLSDFGLAWRTSS